MEMNEKARLARKRLGQRIAVAARALKYIGFTDCSMLWKDVELHQFNVMVVGHEKYRSTLTEKVGGENE